MSIFDIPGAVVDAAHSAIEGLAHLFVPFAGTAAAALAIVVFTLLVRLLISPLTYQQVRGQRRQAALAPQIEELREKHGDDRIALATETLALQRANGASPFAAFLPALAQAPFFMVMYRVAMHAPAGALFGVPLTAHLTAGLPVFAVLIVAAGALAWWSSRRMSRTMQPTVPSAAPGRSKAVPGAPGVYKPVRGVSGGSKAVSGAPGRIKAARGARGRDAAAPSRNNPDVTSAASNPLGLLRFLPYLTVAVVAWMPLAGALYLVTSTAWTALEQAVYRRPAAPPIAAR